MKKLVASIHAPGRLTVLAALLAGICAPAMAASDIVISQVYGGGGNASSHYKNDFVELFNRGTSAVTISNWSLQYTSAAGNSWGSNKTTIAGPFTLQPGQYLLVQEAANSPVSGDAALLPAAEVTGAVNMSGTAGKIALVNNNTNLSTSATPTDTSIVDLVGYGSTANFSEGAVAPAPSNTNSIQRKLAGCTDADNNGSDFAAGVALPRNGSTPLNACAGGPPPAAAPIVLTCPASLPFLVGSGAFAALTATDSDSIVNGVSITAGAMPGITLGALTAAGAKGGTASVNLNVDASVAAGSYPVEITFTNGDAQSKSCTVNVANATPRTIMEIQGSGAISPFNNTVQATEGVITVKTSSGFYIQDLAGDNNPATSDAILVFGSTTNFQPGDLVRVIGTVTEFTPGGGDHSITEFKNVGAVTKISSNNIITPVNITAPAAGLAQYESMLVRVTNPLTVNDTSSLGGFGELTLSDGRREIPTNHYPAGSAGALALAAANAANAIVLGDGGVNNPIPFIGEGTTVRVGDTVTDLVGVVDYGAIGGGQSSFKIQPVALAPTFSRTNARLLAPIVPQGNVKVASANVLNFFTTFTDGTDVLGNIGQGCSLGASTAKGNCRGADSIGEFNRQLAKIVNELKAIDADVVGLMEIQNNGEKAVSYLVNSLNTAIGSTTYAYVPMPPATGTDAIRVAMIYKPAVVSLAGPAMSDGDAVNNRPPMAQTFKASNGAKFSVIVNHLKSKSGCPAAKDSDAPGNLDAGDSQGCWNASRVQQAQRLASFFIPQVVSVSGDPDVLLIGDMNSHGFEDPINVLTGTGMVNELERFVRPNGIVYSYVFDGESGYLDHALATASLDGQMAGATEWHNNADEPEVIDYNFNLGTSTAAKPQDLFVNNAYRASDHDPVVVSLNLAPTFVDATSSFNIMRNGLSVNRTTGKYTGTISIANKTAAAVNGPFQVMFNGLTAGVTLANASGAQNGTPYITLGNTSIAPGATVSVPVTFDNPSKAVVSYTTTIISGNF